MSNLADSRVGRLAPSPTGAQHIGNARTYLLAWLSTRHAGGRVILRIEDIDSPRVKAWAVEQACEDLQWLGLDWDEGPGREAPSAPYVQTERMSHYQVALEQLKQANQIYPCTCSRADVAAAASAPHAGHEGPVYPGTCSQRTPADVDALAGQPFSWRFRTRPEEIGFVDRVAGRQQCQLAAELGDFVIYKQDGTPAYQLAVVHDDHTMGVTEVLRGDDLIPSTFRQLAIYEFFGWQPPQFAHVPLVVGEDGRRLAKRHGDTRLHTLRCAGLPPEVLVGYLAHSCGLRPDQSPVSAAELVASFDLARLPRGALTLTAADIARFTRMA